jgi:small-conductance mechanosensitive channel
MTINELRLQIEGVLSYPLFTIGESELTVGTILFLLFAFALVIVAERFLRKQVLTRVLGRTRFDPALQFAVARFTGYVFIVLGFYICLTLVGINLSSLAILAGAVGVGIGFGLQNIVNNFVSGLIILAERPISIGDRVEVAGVAGQVRAINLRSTLVVTNDNISIIVPNGNFISEVVTNWSHGDPKVRFRIPFGVAYGSDVEKLKRVVLELASQHPAALKDPAPDLFFDGFGDSSLNFELVVWSAEMTFKPRRFRSDLNYAVEAALRKNGIEVPFPQRDLHLKSGNWAIESPKSKDSED